MNECIGRVGTLVAVILCPPDAENLLVVLEARLAEKGEIEIRDRRGDVLFDIIEQRDVRRAPGAAAYAAVQLWADEVPDYRVVVRRPKEYEK